MNPTLFVAGLSYRTAAVEVREGLPAKGEQESCIACRMRLWPDLKEGVLLSTCNRVELYGVTTACLPAPDELFLRLVSNSSTNRPALYSHEGEAAARHLFAVTSGLDSMVLGETEITGQVKQAYERARAFRLTGPVLNRLFQRAFQTAKRIRSQTRIGCGAISVGSVAVEAAAKVFGTDLAQLTVLVIGAGRMAEACLRHLAKQGAPSVVVCNRSVSRATELAEAFQGRAIGFAELLPALVEADVIVTSTSCQQTILHRRELEPAMAERGNRPLFLVDIAVPRNVDCDVQQLPNVFLYNIDDLEEVAREHVRQRESERARALEIIAEQVAAFQTQLNAARPEPAPETPPGSPVMSGAAPTPALGYAY